MRYICFAAGGRRFFHGFAGKRYDLEEEKTTKYIFREKEKFEMLFSSALPAVNPYFGALAECFAKGKLHFAAEYCGGRRKGDF